MLRMAGVLFALVIIWVLLDAWAYIRANRKKLEEVRRRNPPVRGEERKPPYEIQWPIDR